MTTTPAWSQIARDPAVLRRAALTGLAVGTILTAAEHGAELLAGSIPPDAWLPIGLLYAVPFVASIAASILVLRAERRDKVETTRFLEREIEAIVRFPGQNPNPVMRVTNAGILSYANDSSAPVRAALGAEVGRPVPEPWLSRLRTAATTAGQDRIEVEHGRQTFALLPVAVQDLGVMNVYGTDVTGAKVVARFPDRNPNPVLRMTPDGRLRYANPASAGITEALAVAPGDLLPPGLLAEIGDALADPNAPIPEVSGAGRVYRLRPVAIPEFDFVNLYGTDVTALRAVDKFPNENPNPVLRLDSDGRLTYANPASDLVRMALGAEVGGQLEPLTFQRILDALGDDAPGVVELEAEGRVYEVRVVRVFEFSSINLYGTDVTAARQVADLSAANEKLLLSILPPSIAERLRGGETVIADRFDDMAVLFADIVGFTELASRLTPTEVIELLNTIFRMCDELAERFGLEKIKTVGDAYMVVGGVGLGGNGGRHSDNRTHAEDVADMALVMLEELGHFGARTGMPIQVRVGMHVGPAVAGVIGLKKFIYDVWGDTVNTASRMESTGLPDRIQVTRETFDRLRDAFDFERRGVVDVKGKGKIETWFLLGRRAERAAGAGTPGAAVPGSAALRNEAPR